ncbi:MAG TPA: AMP-binding protein [Terriglobales bacterium]|nr:AMP-binding protein [Terriglobales bacterium]
MKFPQDIFVQLDRAGDTVVLHELRESEIIKASGRDLLRMIAQGRAFLAGKGLKKGDRCGLLAHNSIHWIAMDLAMIAEGLIVVPLYARQAPADLVGMMKDCSASLICCGDAALKASIIHAWPAAPPLFLLEEIFATTTERNAAVGVSETDPVAIIYTSGTSGEPKGVVLTAGNVGHVLGCTSERLDVLMKNRPGQDRVYQYAPLCFAAAWITLLTSLFRGSLITMNTDLSKISTEIRGTEPDYFVNVPALLERVRRAVDDQLWKTGGLPLTIYGHAKAAWMRKQEGKSNVADSLWLKLANVLIFPAIRKKMIGGSLKALICGSAPLNVETQLYFMMLGIPVLQVYGLTETTAICTMDDPRHVEPGRVGPAIPGIEMKLADNEEIVVRGPNVFAGYWRRPEETAKALKDGWFHTGDQGEVNQSGNWKIVGRIKNLIILNSGHNIAPEPVEEELLRSVPDAQQVIVVGNGRGYLSAIVTGQVTREQVQSAVDGLNARLPHYKQIRAFQIHPKAFSVDDGLVTINGKLKRDLIAARLKNEIEEMYRVKQAV